MRNIMKNHYGSLLLFIFFLKALISSLTFPEALTFGVLAVFAGFQVYLNHLRMHNYHQKQINLIKKDIHQLKSISTQIKGLNTTLQNVPKMQDAPTKTTWSGMNHG